jgi:MFS family permease
VGMFLLAGVRSDRLKGRTLFWTGITSGISPILLAVVSSVPLAIFSSAAMGASQGVFMALTSTYVQSIAPDRLRSRISSLYILHAGGIMAFANLGYGFMADAFSAPPILLVTAVIFLVIVVGLSRSQPVLRQVYRTGDVVLG